MFSNQASQILYIIYIDSLAKCNTLNSITCYCTGGVPLNVVEVLGLPPEGTHERQQAFQILREMGAFDFKGGKISRTGEEVTVAVFDTPDTAMKALHFKHPHFALSIPRNNHAKFILTLLHVLSS